MPLSIQGNKWILTNKMLGENPAIDLQPIKGQYSSTKLKARSKVVRAFGVVSIFHFIGYRIRLIPLKCTTTGHRKLSFFILTLRHSGDRILVPYTKNLATLVMYLFLGYTISSLEENNLLVNYFLG